MYLNYVYDLDRHGGLVTAEPHWARKENAHAVVSVRKAGKEIKEMTHNYVVYVQLTKKENICLVGNRLLLWLLARARIRRAQFLVTSFYVHSDPWIHSTHQPVHLRTH